MLILVRPQEKFEIDHSWEWKGKEGPSFFLYFSFIFPLFLSPRAGFASPQSYSERISYENEGGGGGGGGSALWQGSRYLDHAKFVLDKSELQALEPGGRWKIIPVEKQKQIKNERKKHLSFLYPDGFNSNLKKNLQYPEKHQIHSVSTLAEDCSIVRRL